MSSALFSPFSLGALELANHLVMAPMTRNRAEVDGRPTASMVTYYAQRATAGLIITEGAQPSAVGQAYPNTPGLHTVEQAAAWRLVTDAVHAEGGVIFLQIMHAGRISHPGNQPGGSLPIGASAVAPAGQIITPTGPQDMVAPRPLETDEIAGVIDDYVTCATLAVERAGFDGVEIHGANGYLPQQFLAENTNTRTDGYGGSATNRARFVVEIAQAVSAAIGAERVGIRLSPTGTFNDIAEADPAATYAAVLAGLAPLSLAFVHLVEGSREITAQIRAAYDGVLIVNAAFSLETSRPNLEAFLAQDRFDLVAVGRAFISNPDLVARLRADAALTPADGATFYGGTDAGYTDYPTLGSATVGSAA